MRRRGHGLGKWACILILLPLAGVSAMAVCGTPLLGPSTHFRGLVVIDAGHGGNDPGAQGKSHSVEKDINLAIANAVAADLRARGVQVSLTRRSDTFVPLDSRVSFSNRRAAKLFVSIHCDYTPDSSMHGFSVLVPRTSSQNAQIAANDLAQCLESANVQCHGVRRDDRGLKVLNGTQSPAVLVETGFLSNRVDAANLTTSRYQRKVAAAVADGIVEYLKQQ